MNAVNRFIPSCTEDVFTCFMCTLTYDFFFLIGLTDGVGFHWFAVEWMAAVQLYVYVLKHLHSRSHSFTSPSKADTWLETCLMPQKKKFNICFTADLTIWQPLSSWKIHKFIFLQQRSSLFCFAADGSVTSLEIWSTSNLSLGILGNTFSTPLSVTEWVSLY